MPGETEFDSLRIRRTIALRRGLYRGRSYALISAIACLAAAAQCAYLGWEQVRQRHHARVIILGFVTLTALCAAVWLARRFLALQRELSQSHLPQPSQPPDFSTLSDGSQRARNLTEVRSEEQDE